jgi:DNA-binding response OmpR family regulator
MPRIPVAEEDPMRADGMAQDAAPVRCGRLVLEPWLRRATCAGAAIELSEREFDLLHVLVTERGQLAARSRIAHALAAGEAAIGDGAIDVYVHRLRRKLEPHGVRISTLRRIGYGLHDDAARASTAHEINRHEGVPR